MRFSQRLVEGWDPCGAPTFEYGVHLRAVPRAVLLRHAESMLLPLLLTGGPGAGKSSTSRQLALTRSRAALIDVDDLRHLVVAGHVAPWNGKAGALQQQIGVHNACDLTHRFVEAGIEVDLADIVTAHTLKIYRDRVPEILVIRLRVSLTEARRRAALRTYI